MNEYQREDLIRKVELKEGHRAKVLDDLGIPRSTYYKWRKTYDDDGLPGLAKTKPKARHVWNRFTDKERERVFEIARLHPELPSRLLSVKITDEESFSISESTVYRILKENNLIAPRPLPEMPAKKGWQHKTKRPDELWQTDATNIFVVGWGYYRLIPVEDDYSRKIIGYDVLPDEASETRTISYLNIHTFKYNVNYTRFFQHLFYPLANNPRNMKKAAATMHNAAHR